MKHYEKFKSESSRLISMECDRCGREMYNVPDQPYYTIGYGLHYPRTKHDLCDDCLQPLVKIIEDYIQCP